jgi:hypothetical protein
MGDLSKHFKSRDADVIVDGLAKIAELQADRLEKTMDAEDPAEPDPDVTRQINSLFSNGVKLAKLRNPALAGPGTKVNINIGSPGSAAAIEEASPRRIMQGIYNAFENAGFARSEITKEMVQGALEAMKTATPLNAVVSTAVVERDKLRELAGRTIDGESKPAIPDPFAA